MLPMIYMLDLLGTATFAVTGALAAGRKRMDVFGVVVLGCVTAVGGGTLRDVILGNHPVFWISDNIYLLIAALAAVVTFLIVRYHRIHTKVLAYADAGGLAIFTIIGFRHGLDVTGSYIIAIVMGVMTGVVGGMIRDVLSGEIPLILRREIYASASLCGAALFALLHYFQVPGTWSVITAVLTILIIRIAALYWNVSLPLFRLKDSQEID